MKTNLTRNNETTPTEKLIRNVLDLEESEVPVVLLGTGGFNPAHSMHLQMYVRAREHIEKTNPNLRVVAGFVSPSHDEYVTQKLTPYSTIPQHDRVQIINIWINKLNLSSWMFVDQGESKHHKFVDHSTVLHTLRKFLVEKHPSLRNIRTMYLAGRDLWLRTRGMGNLQKPEFGVVVIWRKETSETSTSYHRKLEEELLQNQGENLFIVPSSSKKAKVEEEESDGEKEEEEEEQNFSVSSTIIRKFIKEKKFEEINEKLFCKEAIEYVREKNLLSEPYFCSERMRVLFAPYVEQIEKKKKEEQQQNNNNNGCKIL